MKKYTVEPDIEGMLERLNGKKIHQLFWELPSLSCLGFIGSSLVMVFLGGFHIFNVGKLFIAISAASTILILLYSFVSYRLFVRGDIKLFHQLLSFSLSWPVFICSMNFLLISSANSFFTFFMFFMFLIFFIFSAFAVSQIRGVDIDVEFKDNFIPKEDGFVFMARPEIFDPGNATKQLLKKSGISGIMRLTQYAAYTVIPVAIWLFPQVYRGDDTQSGAFVWLSVLLLLIFIGLQMFTLIGFTTYRAIRRREMGFGIIDR